MPRTAEAPSWTARGGTPLPSPADLDSDDAELNLDSQLPLPVPTPLELPPPSSSPPAAAIPRPLDLTPSEPNQTSVPWTGQESAYTIPRRSTGGSGGSSPNSGPALLPTTSSDTGTPRQFRR